MPVTQSYPSVGWAWAPEWGKLNLALLWGHQLTTASTSQGSAMALPEAVLCPFQALPLLVPVSPIRLSKAEAITANRGSFAF